MKLLYKLKKQHKSHGSWSLLRPTLTGLYENLLRPKNFETTVLVWQLLEVWALGTSQLHSNHWPFRKQGCCWVVKHLKRIEMASITARRNLDKKAEELFKETHCKYYKKLLFRVSARRFPDFDCSRHFSKHQHRSIIRAHLSQCLWKLRDLLCTTASFVW